MIYGMVQFQLKNFDDFIAMGQQMATLGANYGMISTKIYRNLEDPNFITMLVEWETDEHIAQFIADTRGETEKMLTAPPTVFNISEMYEFYS